MPILLTLPTGYPWVLAVTTGHAFINVWQSMLVGVARKKAGIKYPQMYATKEQETASKDALVYNCTQRAHQNAIESVNFIVLTTLIAGLRFPRLTVGLAALNLIGKVAYTLGYTTGEPSKRSRGAIPATLAHFGLIGTATFAVFQFLRESDFQL